MELATIEQTTAPFLGQWQRLISTTNWEKGKIIWEWRQALIDADADVSEYADEAWSRRVGHVSPQHVGRLRRTYERFGEAYPSYPGLYWSHFQMALDWHDAEMWLEGAVQNGWSVSEMREARWQAIGAPEELKPRDSDVISTEFDEDAPTDERNRLTTAIEPAVTSLTDEEGFPPLESSDRWDSEEAISSPKQSAAGTAEWQAETPSDAAPRQPFAELPSLPSDVSDAFEQFKLCIIRHRLDNWQEISQADMLATLDALKELALAPPVAAD